MLEKFEDMDLKDSKRAFIIYMNFIKINQEIKKMASSIILEFNIKLGINFYEVDTRVVEALKVHIESKDRANKAKTLSVDFSDESSGMMPQTNSTSQGGNSGLQQKIEL